MHFININSGVALEGSIINNKRLPFTFLALEVFWSCFWNQGQKATKYFKKRYSQCCPQIGNYKG